MSSTSSIPRSDVVSLRGTDVGDALIDSDRRRELPDTRARAALRRLTRTLARLHSWTFVVDLDEDDGPHPRWLADLEVEILDGAASVCEVSADGWTFATDAGRSLAQAQFRACVAFHGSFDLDLVLHDAHGRQHTFRCVGEAASEQASRVVSLIGVVQEVTEHRDASLRADSASAQLKATLDAVRDGFFTVDRNWRLTVANRAAVTSLSRPSRPVLGESLWEVAPRLLGTAFERMYRTAMETGEAAHFEGFFAARREWIEVDAYPFAGGLTVCFRNVTERRTAEHRVSLLGTAISQLPEFFLLARRNGPDPAQSVFEYTNRAYERRVGVGPGELVGRTMEECRPADSDAAVRRWIDDAVLRGGRSQAEFCVHDAEGAERWVEIEVSTIEIEGAADTESPHDPEHGHWLLLSRDISERKAREGQVRENLARFHGFARATNDTVWDWDLRRDELWWSDALETTFGHSLATFPKDGEGWKSRIHPDDRERVVSEVLAVIDAGGDQWSGAYRFARADGTYADVLDRGRVLRDGQGKAIRMVGGLTDVTQRNREQAQLAEQAALLDLARDAIMLREVGGEIRFWSRGAETIYGYPAAEALGQDSATLLQHAGAAYEEAMRHLLAHDEWQGELHSQRKDGAKLVIESRWTLVRDAHGAPHRVLCINSDITEKKLLETQFLRAQRLESIGTLAGGIAHDLNNVLMPILMSAELLKSSAVDDEAREYVENVRVSAQRAADMVKQVLSFARGVEGERVAVQLRHLADEVVRIAGETFPKSIRVDMRYAHELWPIIGSPTQLSQVILNLLVNARDAMPHGGRVVVSLENTVLDEVYTEMNPDAAPGPYVVVKVTDNGEGIPAAIQDRVFEPFFTTKEVGKGTGLGLSTALGIVKSHRGFVHLYSEMGKGTTFKLYFPASANEVAVQDHALLNDKDSLPRGMGETVLVVDDERAIRDIMERTLTRFGYQVLVAANGAEAVALYAQQQHRIDVVLTDMAMPIMDGPATAVALRSINPNVKIIGSSGLAANGLVAKAAGAGVQSFIPKPYSAEAVLQMLRQVLAGDDSALARDPRPPSPARWPSSRRRPDKKRTARIPPVGRELSRLDATGERQRRAEMTSGTAALVRGDIPIGVVRRRDGGAAGFPTGAGRHGGNGALRGAIDRGTTRRHRLHFLLRGQDVVAHRGRGRASHRGRLTTSLLRDAVRGVRGNRDTDGSAALLRERALFEIEARRDDGDLDDVAEALVDGRAPDDVGVFVGLLLDEACRLLDLLEAHVRPAREVDEHAHRAHDGDVVEQRRRDRLLGGEERAALTLRAARAHEGATHAGHDGADVGEVDVHHALLGDEVADAFDGLVEHFVGLAEAFDQGHVFVRDRQELLVRDRDQRVDLLGQHRETLVGDAHAALALEAEGLGHHTDGERAFFPSDLRDDRCRARARATAHAGRHEHHVGAVNHLFDALRVLERRLATLLGIGAGTEATRDLATDLHLQRSGAGVDRLQVRVDRDELDPFEAEIDHRVDGVSAGATAPDDLDTRVVLQRFVRKLD
jgi:PAS domain S-box-containing protein